MSDFHLIIERNERVCLFELTWGKGQRLRVSIPYPENLTRLYFEWQRSYLSYYNQASLRGKVADCGIIAAPSVDLHACLVQAEAQLLSEFHKWLRSGELYELRMVMANAAVQQATNNSLALNPEHINVFITCNTIDLERLPWEVWEIGTEFALASGKIRIARTSVNIRKAIESQYINNRRHRKVRILAILGDDRGLKFKTEKEAIHKLKSIADVKFVGWEQDKNILELKNEIKEALISETGWDILFFAGHSNETKLTGGEIAIAPNTALSMIEIAPFLTVAVQKGLKFAIFNSCNGLNIANSLIDVGISQVAVMREPIHNSVAEKFFVQFMQTLAEFKDVHEALLSASQYLKNEMNLTYPSAYLIPSLFRHPEAPLFRPESIGIKDKLKKIIPSRKEAAALLALSIVSLQLPVQGYLLGNRLWMQSLYRGVTGQIGKQEYPPVLLVNIDEKSIENARITNPRPMNRKYVASLVDKLTTQGAKTIGIDFLFDRYNQAEDKTLAQSIKNGVNAPTPTWFTFAATHSDTGEWRKVVPSIASPNWSLDGEIEILFCDKIQRVPCYMQLLPSFDSNLEILSFSSLLTLSSLQPKLYNKSNFKQDLNNYFIQNKSNNYSILNSQRSRLQPITESSYIIGQMWLHPIIDFSIPPNQVYQSIPAWKLLEQSDNSDLKNIQQQVVIIAAGGYGEAGMSKDKEDNFDLPLALEFWRHQQGNNSLIVPGGEIHAYMTHHLLKQRLVIPIPDIWMIGIAVLLGKYLYHILRQNPRHRWQWFMLLSLLTGIYGLISLQIYLSAVAIILPWFLPTFTLWMYCLPALVRKKVYE